MKKFITVFAFLLFPSLLMAQTHSFEDFGGATFPPTGWTIDAHEDNWSANSGNNAGGILPEARFTWAPQFVGESRLICPPMDLTGVTDLKVEFKHNLDHYGGAYTIGAATRSGGGNWNVVWELVDPPASIPATTEYATINNSDVGASDFQICWFFSGNSYNLNDWYIDDCRLFTPFAHDVMVRDIPIETQYTPGATVTPKGLVKNFGLGTETFDVTCEIKIDGSSVYTQTSSSVTLTPDEEQTVTFPDYTAAAANELFEMIITTNLSGDMDPSNDSMTKWFNTYTTEREMVLLEIGTGTWCVWCPGAALGADDLVHFGHNVAVLEHHYNDPYENTYSLARIAYYGITAYPTAVFDGVDYYIGGDQTSSIYTTYLPIYEGREAINVAFDVGIFGTNTGLDYSLNLVVDKMASIPSDWNNLVLHLALTESHIPEVWFGLDTVNFVNRLMLPDENGTPIDMITNSSLQVDLNFTLDATWVADNCELICFVQNLDNKEILQGAKVKLNDLLPTGVDDFEFGIPEVFALNQNYPNPFNPSTKITYALPNQSPVVIKVYDLTGQEVITLVDEVKEAGTYEINFDALNLSSGVYIYQMRAGDFSSVKKMSILK